ncbi:hypothetical protein LC2W_0266 [Lacticaseibacillus paracasei]|nr:hypothetical protein LC2W_0266 [Lacticaseibacillus paracasei]AEA55775.1 Hypothetical cytosolic protein [Lacticaseibacillus paracasei]EPC31703.1 hypothetical protein Lpp223_2438 [Lacticaseibacillus paracasei subsp. paracasei Lpp223]
MPKQFVLRVLAKKLPLAIIVRLLILMLWQFGTGVLQT